MLQLMRNKLGLIGRVLINFLQKNVPKRYYPAEVFGLKPHESTDIQLIRSLVVSCIALIFDFGTLVFLKELLDVNYLLAAGIGFSVGVLINYYLSIKWVFTNRKLEHLSHELFIFVVICLIGLLLNLLIIFLLVEQQSFDYRIAKIFSTIVVFFFNFIARKKVLF
jgi:putative flippase GtrA